MECILGYTTTFCAAHSLPNHPKCKQLHGHTYKVLIEIRGPVEDEANRPDYGMVRDFHHFKRDVEDTVTKLDHSLLNDAVSYPTAEYLARYLWKVLLHLMKTRTPDITLKRIRVYESENTYAELTNDTA